MTPASAPDLAARIARTFGMADARLFGRGCAGLFALFSALARERGPGDIVVPAMCCETVALAALYAGHEVRIADVSPLTLCLTPETLAHHLSPRTRAVMVVHIFGVDARTEAFSAQRRQWPNVVFVEDLAHAAGGRNKSGDLLGGGLDFTVLSFAHDKILPGDGGALLAATEDRLAAVDAATPRTDASPRRAELVVALRNLVHTFADDWRAGQSVEAEQPFREAAKGFRDLICFGGALGDATALTAGLDALEDTRLRRLARHRCYERALSAPAVPLSDGAMCWRSTFLLPIAADARSATRALRAGAVHASNHYFPLNKLFGGVCPAAEGAAMRVLNLWVSDEAGNDMVSRAIEIMSMKDTSDG